MNPQMPPETQREQKSNALKAFATRSPFFFALVFFVVSFCLSLVGPPASLWGVVQSLFAIGVLAWLGWLRLAGFNGFANLGQVITQKSPKLFRQLIRIPTCG